MTSSPRARYREHTRTEIKDIALRQLADGGAPALALTRIAKEIGLSGPALYRYFDSRDALLGELVQEAYADLGAAVHAAASGRPAEMPGRALLHTLADACRGWAITHPHRYLLIEGTPVPGPTAPHDALDSARAVLGPFLAAFREGRPTAAVQPVVAEMARWAEKDEAVGEWIRQYVPEAEEQPGHGTLLAGAVLARTHLHGVISLEASGRFTELGHPGETLLTAHIDSLADAFGL
ncbi:TetR/AcrR family transcriptional regulator [Streptomyces cavernae]|uniref:TetR/AcrR family transcriptional regulator n=1 Tax=Streptomyces cavernae TaxID=2259034 RepID=UPI0030B82522